jgi:hypothetical protein
MRRIERKELLGIVATMYAIVSIGQLLAVHHEILGLAIFLLSFHQGPGHPAVGDPGREAGAYLLALVVALLKSRIEEPVAGAIGAHGGRGQEGQCQQEDNKITHYPGQPSHAMLLHAKETGLLGKSAG